MSNISVKTLTIKTLLSVLFFFLLNSVIHGQCPANANFTYYVNSCSTLQFTDLSTVSNPNYTIVAWDWDFDDGGTSTIQNPLHTFAPGQTYDVSLTVTADSSGVTCTDNVVHSVVVDPLPVAYFTWDPEPTCLGDATYFYGNSSGDIVQWEWDFGDGGSSNIQNPVHLYTNIGTYIVSVTITDVNGCTASTSDTVEVAEIPDVSFTFSPDPACVNTAITFTGSSSSNIASWEWDFGDGYSGNTQTVDHAYDSYGVYDVTLTVTSVSGCVNSTTQQVSVSDSPSPEFRHDAPACNGDSIHFINFSTTPNGYIETWEWNFGDGNSATINFPDDPDVSHLYDLSGSYDVTLTVTDANGCIDSITKSVSVVQNPVANFYYSDACEGEPVEFTDASSVNGGSNITDWYWNFGDPLSGIYNTSTQQNPTHVFTGIGTYDVRLVVTNFHGCTDTIVKQVTVNTPSNVDFTADRDTACVSEIIQFEGIGDSIISWYWDFGDGGSNIIQNPQYAYGVAGTYNVTLTVQDVNGCSNSVTHPINIKELPNALFDVSSPACAFDSVYFTDYSTSPAGYITTWHWYFGDGTDTIINFPDDPHVAHLYTNASTFDVKLVVTDSYGCNDSITTPITIVASPIADFNHTTGCYQEAVEFTDVSVPNGGGNIVDWFWDFGDPLSGINNYSTLQNPTHVFSDSGIYIVNLTVYNATGCFDTVSHEVTINSLPDIDFNIYNDSTCAGNIVDFEGLGNNIVSWYWEFGDGGNATGQNTQHIYSQPGLYEVSLTAIDDIGCVNTVTHNVWVNELPVAQFTYTNNCYMDSTYFYDGSFSNNSYLNSWYWDFDDPASSPNDTSTLRNPAHLFSAPGTYQVKLVVTDINGCEDSIIRQVQVFEPPVADYSFNIVCEPHGTVYFNDESSPGSSGSSINEWLWEIDEGYYSNEMNPHYTYTITDTCYPVTLTVTDLNGCSSSHTDTVCIPDPLEVDFTATRECQGVPTFFNASYLPDNDSVVSWRWEFGDGTPMVTTAYDTISYIYNTSGTFQVVLTAVNEHGCTASNYHTIIVDPKPLPDFTYNNAICDQPTQFQDISSGNGYEIQSWYWDFGDVASGSNNFSTSQNPSHLYPINDSTYYVTLTVTNQRGCVDSVTLPVEKDPCLVSAFGIETQPICAGHAECFVDSSQIFNSSGEIINWQWDFGDGNIATYTDFQQTICHVYNNPGIYNVSLQVTGQVGSSIFTDTHHLEIYVNPSPTSDFITSPLCNNSVIEFTDDSDDNGIQINGWRWNFGDPTTTADTSDKQNPTYLYNGPGTYNVELITINNQGCSDTILKTLDVNRRPHADYRFRAPCLNNPTYFLDNSDTSDIALRDYYWNFGVPSTSSDTSVEQNPTFNFSTTGTYDVSLVITDENGCKDTSVQTIEIYEPPISSFIIEEDYEGVQGQVLFENLSINSDYYFWDFGNGDSSYLEEPIISYEENGKYMVMLIAYNNLDCSDSSYYEYDVILKGLYIPNAFAPLSTNPDVKYFKPKGYYLKEFKIEVYSKWGKMVWSSSQLDSDGRPMKSWDGKLDGELLPQGAYVWRVQAMFKDNTYWKGNDIGDGNNKTYGTVNMIH